jgi:hypothetical protein
VGEMPPDPPLSERRQPRVVSLDALRSTLGRTPLWITTAAFTVLMALVLAAPWFGWLREALDHRYEPGGLLRSLDETFRFDHREGLAQLERTARSSGAALALLAMLAGVFAAGGWLQVFLERTHGHSLRRFFFGGSRYFWRFFRVLVLTLLSLALIGWVLYGKPWEWAVQRALLGLEGGDLEGLESELDARRVVFIQDGIFLALVALVLAWGDYTRTRLALHDTSSAVWAGLCSWVLLFAHPLRTLRPLLALWLAEALVLWLAGFASDRAQAAIGDATPGWLPVAVLALIGIVVILWRSVVRGAHYGVALQVSGQLVRPLPRPDPWRQSLGGPGGPRYPIGGEDEYGVSL